MKLPERDRFLCLGIQTAAEVVLGVAVAAAAETLGDAVQTDKDRPVLISIK